MRYTKEQRQKAYKSLPPEVQSFIMDNETTDLTETLLLKYGINDENTDLADTEILCTMYGLQNLDQAIQSIATISGKSTNDLQGLKNDLQKNIFYKIEEIKNPKPSVSKVISEISQKYSLSENQAIDLEDVYTRMGYDKDEPHQFISEIINNLGVSEVLAEQIGQDIDKRVTSRPQKIISVPTEAKTAISSTKNPIPKMIYPENKTPASVPEIKPNNLPMGSNEPVKVGVPRYIPGESKPTQATTSTTVIRDEQTISGSRITYGQTATTETAQKPVNAPELDITKKEAAPVIPSPSSNKSIIDEKLNKITTGVVEETPKTTPLQKSYSVDPYREPLE